MSIGHTAGHTAGHRSDRGRRARAPGRALLAALGLTVAVTAALCWAPARAAEPGRILFLNAYGYGRAGVESFTRTYVETLAAAGVSSEDVMVEYLNLNRNSEPALRQRMRELLLLQYTQRKPALIVAMQQPALDYLLGELGELTRGVPVLAINASTLPVAAGPDLRILQQRANVDFDQTLAQAMALFPDTRRVVLAVGAGAADQVMKRAMQRAAVPWGTRFAVEYLDALSLAQMRARVAALPPDSVLICGTVNRDKDGALATPLQLAAELARLANVPAFGLYNTSVGQGVIGGSVLHVEREAARLARTSLALLHGSRQLESDLSAAGAEHVPLYDWGQLERWGADPGRLPPDTLFINRPPSLWQEHRAAVLATLAVIGALSALLGVLLVQRRRLRLARADNLDSAERYRILVEYAPEAILVYDPELDRFVDGNRNAELLLGCSRAICLASTPRDFYPDCQPDGRPVADSIAEHIARTMRGEQVRTERLVRRPDGVSFPCEVWLVRLPAAGRQLLRVGFIDISARRRAEQELAQYRDQLEQLVLQRTAALSVAVAEAEAANRAKSVFLANMSHELRTPLNSVIGFAQLMADSGGMSADEKNNLAIIHRAGQHLLTLINDILDLSKIEAGRVQLQLAPVDPGALAEEVLDMVRLRAAGATLRLDRGALPPLVLADGAKLRQVLLNLLSNAVKFAAGADVTLALHASPAAHDPGQVTLACAVRDGGPGIGPEDRERIFEPFVQAATPAAAAGTGLGLAIARQFVRLMGGELSLHSAPGAGADFHFSVTLALAAPGMTLPAAAGRVRALPPAERGRTILVVDDHDDCRALLRALLEPLGFCVLEARDGAAAAERLAVLRPHLVLSDWRMPRMDGLALTRWLRARPQAGQPRVVIMSASAFDSEMREALAAGADAYLRKPIEREPLLAMLEQQLGLHFIRQGGAAAAPVAPPPTAVQLAALDADLRQALLVAVGALDLGRCQALLAEAAEADPALAARIGAMLERHHYPALCQLLQDAAGAAVA